MSNVKKCKDIIKLLESLLENPISETSKINLLESQGFTLKSYIEYLKTLPKMPTDKLEKKCLRLFRKLKKKYLKTLKIHVSRWGLDTGKDEKFIEVWSDKMNDIFKDTDCFLLHESIAKSDFKRMSLIQISTLNCCLVWLSEINSVIDNLTGVEMPSHHKLTIEDIKSIYPEVKHTKHFKELGLI